MFAGDGSKHCNFILLEHHALSALKSQLVSLWSSELQLVRILYQTNNHKLLAAVFFFIQEVWILEST
jgi:hypothetical protein